MWCFELHFCRPMTTEKLPRSYFTTAALDSKHKFDAWKESISIMCDVAPTKDGVPIGFETELESYMIGSILAVYSKIGDQTLYRDRRTIARDGMDHIMIQYFPKGGNQITTARGTLRAGPGDIQIIDMTQNLSVTTCADYSPGIEEQLTDTVTMFFGREKFEALLPMIHRFHGRVLAAGTPLNGLLRTYLQGLWQNAPLMTQKEANAVAQPTIGLLAAVLGETPDLLDQAQETIHRAALARVFNFINTNIENPRLGPNEIMAHLGVSRASLFRLCKPYGGVMAMIRERRLFRARQLLARSDTSKSIKFMAHNLGFDSASQFARAYRGQFGFSPSETREFFLSTEASRLNTKNGELPIGDRNYEYWMANLVG